MRNIGCSPLLQVVVVDVVVCEPLRRPDCASLKSDQRLCYCCLEMYRYTPLWVLNTSLIPKTDFVVMKGFCRDEACCPTPFTLKASPKFATNDVFKVCPRLKKYNNVFCGHVPWLHLHDNRL